MHDQFKYFLINEQKFYLGAKAGDILTALQNLEEDAPNMGNRALNRAAQGIVNQIRRVLHGRWDDSDVKYLKKLQKVGVALMKAIDEKDDMEEIVASSGAELQSLLTDLEMPINSLGGEDEFSGKNEDQPLNPGTDIDLD
jgi:hypothetical protein